MINGFLSGARQAYCQTWHECATHRQVATKILRRPTAAQTTASPTSPTRYRSLHVCSSHPQFATFLACRSTAANRSNLGRGPSTPTAGPQNPANSSSANAPRPGASNSNGVCGSAHASTDGDAPPGPHSGDRRLANGVNARRSCAESFAHIHRQPGHHQLGQVSGAAATAHGPHPARSSPVRHPTGGPSAAPAGQNNSMSTAPESP